MKKSIFIGFFALLILASCNKDEKILESLNNTILQWKPKVTILVIK
jgi:hypothetical protein